MNKLTIVRGVPGTGKSTKAKTLGGLHIESDMYWYANNGTYDFDFSKLRWAHEWCLTTAKTMLRNGHQVVVSNTFTTWKEIKDYIRFAIQLGIPYEIITMTHEYGNIHDVPEQTMDAMRARFQSHEHVLEQCQSLEAELNSAESL